METPQQNSISTLLQSRRFLVIAGSILLLLLTGIGIFVLVSNNKPPQDPIPEGALYAPDEIVAKFTDGYTPAPQGDNNNWDTLYEKLQELGVISYSKVFDSEDPELSRFYTLHLTDGADVERIREELYKLEEIESSEPEYILSTQATVDDAEYPTLWGFNKIDIERAWDVTKGSRSVNVAVVDTGIDYNHPDFAGQNIIKGMDVSTCDSTLNELKSSGGECTKQKQRDNDPMDSNGHGTHVAGTIGAAANNRIGVAGVNWDVTLIAVKVLGAGGAGGLPQIADGIRDAVDRGADIINMSLGGPAPCSQGSAIKAAVDYAQGKGVTIIAAAGNNNVDASAFTPANCNGVISVGATGVNDERAEYSNFGSSVDISAPGGNERQGTSACTAATCINSTWVGSGYRAVQGTSMASPHVAGVAALLLAQNSALTPYDIRRCLIEGGDPITTDKPIGGKRLNAYSALNGCAADSSTNSPVDAAPTPTSTPVEAPGQQPSDGTSRDYFIRGVVYEDKNKNLSRDADEGTVAGIVLSLSGAGVGEAVTGADGEFLFPNLQKGTYLLTASANGVGFMEYIFTLDNAMSSYHIPVPMPPQNPDNPPAPVQRENRTLITGTITPSPTPRPLFTCRERTTNRQVNNRTVQMKYLDCVPQ